MVNFICYILGLPHVEQTYSYNNGSFTLHTTLYVKNVSVFNYKSTVYKGCKKKARQYVWGKYRELKNELKCP